MNRPNRLPILSSLLMLAIAVAIGAAATASFPGAVSAQAYPEFHVENVRAEGKANEIKIIWEPPPPAKDRTVSGTTYDRVTGVSKYVLRFRNRPARDITVSSQGVDVSTTVSGLQPGKRYHFSIQTCFDGTAGYSGCFLPEGHRAAYTAPKAPLFLSANNADGDSISLSWEGGNTLDRRPLDFYDYFECEGRIATSNSFADCEPNLSERAKTATTIVFNPGNAYEFRVRHKARSTTVRTSQGDDSYDVKVSYEAGPWREVRVDGKPKAPANVRVTRTGNSATVEWDPVTQTTANQAVLGTVSYLVAYYIPADCSTTSSQCPTYAKPKWATSTTSNRVTVSGLRSNKTYAFSVLSRTEHRIGESSGWVEESRAAQSNRLTIVQQYDTDSNGSISQDELLPAVKHFYKGLITYEELQELIGAYDDSQSE